MKPSEAGLFLGRNVRYILAGELLVSQVVQISLMDSDNIYVSLKSGVFVNIDSVVLCDEET